MACLFLFVLIYRWRRLFCPSHGRSIYHLWAFAVQDSRFSSAHDKSTGYRTTSILCTPVFDPFGQLVAVLQCINKAPEAGGTFTDIDQVLVENLSRHVGIVLQNAKMYESERSASEKIMAMVEVMKTIHSGATSTTSLIFTLSNRCHELVDADRFHPCCNLKNLRR